MQEGEQVQPSMTKEATPRKRNAILPRTYNDSREYMHHKAKEMGYPSTIEYIEAKAAPQRAVNAFIKARNMQDDQHESRNN